jgi:dTDP-4-dehydrorhamnose reductase
VNVLIAGATGQVAMELMRTLPPGVRAVAAGRERMDVCDPRSVEAVAGELKPQLVINAAAYTAVDRAESEPDAAFAINAGGAANLARVAGDLGARLIHLSTDFVFAGIKARPYQPEDPTGPLGVYGASKLEGERLVLEALGKEALIVRTAWVYSQHGHNFVKTMLGLFDRREQVGVVADQIGTPTWARGLAEAIWQCAALDLRGIHHWTDAGVASWYDFAVAIKEEARALGIPCRDIPILPLRTEDYPTASRRPSYSVLDKSSLWSALGRPAPHWRASLRRMLREMRDEG